MVDCPILNFTSRRRTGAIRSRATLPLPLPIIPSPPPPLGVPTNVAVVPTLQTPTVEDDPCVAAVDVVEPRTGVVVTTAAVAAMGMCCAANNDDGRVNGVDGGSAGCPGADRLGMDIAPVGLVLTGVFVAVGVVVVGSGAGSSDGGGKGGGGGAGDTEGEVPIRPRPVNGEGDECKPGHREDGVCTFPIDDGGILPTAVVGGMSSPTCCC